MVDTFSKAERSRIMAAVKAKGTSPELAVRTLVHALGYRFRLHRRSLPGTPDLVFPRLKKAINVNGCFWHLHGCGRCRIPVSRRDYWLAKLQRNAARDKCNQRLLREAGWKLLVVWECQTRPAALARLRAKIAAFLGPARAGMHTPGRQEAGASRTD